MCKYCSKQIREYGSEQFSASGFCVLGMCLQAVIQLQWEEHVLLTHSNVIVESSCCFYLRVRKVVNVTVVDLQQSVSILEAAVSCCPSGRHRSDDVTQTSSLNPQTEAVGLPFLTVEEAQSWAGCCV